MAPHRTRRINILVAAFAVQFLVMVILAIAGAPADYAPFAIIIPAIGLAWAWRDSRRRP